MANRLTYKGSWVQLSVPATSANLGPGFDCFGLALDLRDRYAATILDDAELDIEVTGEGSEEVRTDAKNLVVRAMYKGFEFMGGKPRGFALRALNATPHGRGLGSSASAIVGGLALARGLVLNGEQLMRDEDLLVLATDMEGHPDNVAAALLGGATIAWMEEGRGRAISIPVDARISTLLLIPQEKLATSKARKVLPETISHQEAVLNSANTALLARALSERPDLLFQATRDYLHQSYRREAMPRSVDLVGKLRDAGVSATISGAGPSVLVFLSTPAEQNEMADIAAAAGVHFQARPLAVSRVGLALH